MEKRKSSLARTCTVGNTHFFDLGGEGGVGSALASMTDVDDRLGRLQRNDGLSAASSALRLHSRCILVTRLGLPVEINDS
jgi:hypothetical protein